MLHGSLIAPDESQFAVSPSRMTEAGAGPDGGSAGFVVIPDAHLLFNCEFTRIGNDLKLVGEGGKTFVVHDYFKTDRPPALVTPDGAHLSGETIDAIAGDQAPGQYAQAAAQPGAGEAIGKVATAAGNATIVRNGVAITVNAGDVILKNDVLRTGGDGALGVIFNDGTTFSLTANAQMVVNEFVYQEGGANNQALFSLVRGSISFFASQVAKTGDMKVATPTATMGIRGTTVIVDIVVDTQTPGAIGQVNIKLYPDANGNVGRVEVFAPNGTLLGTLTQSATGFTIRPAGPLQAIAEQAQINPAEAARDLAILQSLFNSSNIGQQLLQQQQQQQQTPNPNDRGDNNTGPQNTGGGGSSTPTDIITVTVNTTTTQTGDGTTQTIITDVQITQPDGTTTPVIPLPDPTTPPPVVTPDTPPPIVTDNVIIRGDGHDTIIGTAGNDDIYAGGGNDVIYAGAGNDEVFGEGGNDILIAGEGEGNDVYDGGDGIDTVVFSSTSQGIVVNLATGTASGVEIGSDTLFDIENVTGGAGADHITGTDADNILVGLGGNDTINGAGGNDIIMVNAGDAWAVDGGAGVDRLMIVGYSTIFGEGGEGGPQASDIEIVDLNAAGSNEISLDAEDIANINSDGVLRIVGDENDSVTITDQFAGHPNGQWRPAGQSVEYEGEGADLTPVLFDKYEFVDVIDGVEVVLATVYIQEGVETNLDAPNEVPTGTVGYFEIPSGTPPSYLATPIIAVGLDAVPVYELSQSELDSIGILFVANTDNGIYGTEFELAQERIDAFVQNGGILILHDRFVTNAEDVLPGGDGIDIIRDADSGVSGLTQVNFVDDNGPIADGPGGTLDDASLDGGSYSNHGYAARDTLPEGSIVIATRDNPNEVVTFAYPHGDGWVIYSTIPLDYYLLGAGTSELRTSMEIYAENLLAWAAGLQEDEQPANQAPETDSVTAQGSEDDWTIPVALAGTDPEDGSVTTFRITSLPENGTLFTQDVSASMVPVTLDQLVTLGSTQFFFKPDANWNGTTSFQYVAVDSDGAEDQTPATATIEVAAIPDVVTATVLTDSGFDMSAIPHSVLEATLQDNDASHISLIYNGQRIEISGTGLTYVENGGDVILTGGTLTGIEFRDSEDVVLFEATGFDIPALAMQQAIDHYDSNDGDESEIEALFAAHTYSITGGAGADVLGGGSFDDTIDGGGGADQMAGGEGNDLILVRDNTGWAVDGGAGIDILQLVGDFDILDGNDSLPGDNGPDVAGIEIIDLDEGTANEIDVNAQDVADMNQSSALGTLRVLGGSGDVINLSDFHDFETDGFWDEADEDVTFDDGYTDGVSFDRYVYSNGEAILAEIFIQKDVVVHLPYEAVA
ncbi:MAG: FecR domain-containing protein [Pseudorhodoplanes sp.]|nr:FecR domain-containing protein [Pseudorhodoplanes sp.]